jgi:hypothetical protein
VLARHEFALRADRTEDWRVGAVGCGFLIFVPIVVIAWSVSPAVGVGATAAALILAVVGSSTWGGSGPYRG